MTERRQRILLVEDEPVNMIVLSACLRHAGYHVDERTDGLKAWQQLNQDSDYDLVVTDRLMPHMDGLELFACMKKDARFSNIPVIMQTAASAPEQVVEGIRSGVYYYLNKAYQEETLLTLVQSSIREREQRTLNNERMLRQRDALALLKNGDFTMRTIEDAHSMSSLLGGLLPKNERAISGLYELFLNAIEHGNLGIGHKTKAGLLQNFQWEAEIKRRLSLPQQQDRHVTIHFSRYPTEIEITIRDQGSGFDWRPYLKLEPSRVTQPNGRGIARANLAGFSSLSYLDHGRAVRVTGLL